MPYIKPDRRNQLDPIINDLDDELRRLGDQDGDLNYAVTRLVLGRWRRGGRYVTANALMGVLSCVAREFYRRHVVPYENQKAVENGDVR